MTPAAKPQWLTVGVLLAVALPRCLAQTAPAAALIPAAQNLAQNLLGTAKTEETRGGTYVFYAQRYIDTANHDAAYTGSVYGALQSMKIDGCKMRAQVVLTDLFSGTAGTRVYRGAQDNTVYSVAFTLTRAIANSLSLTQARPIQLEASTHSICKDNPSCSFTWLTIRSAPGAIQEVDTLNDLQIFRGLVSQFQIPLSTPEVGRRLIAEFRALADAQCP